MTEGPPESCHCQESGSEKLRFICPALRAGWDVTYSPILRPRNWGPRKSPAKRVLWGEDEQGSEHDSRRQAEMKLSGLCEDEGGPGVQALWTKARPWRLKSIRAQTPAILW